MITHLIAPPRGKATVNSNHLHAAVCNSAQSHVVEVTNYLVSPIPSGSIDWHVSRLVLVPFILRLLAKIKYSRA